MIAAYFRSISHPINRVNGSPLATKKTIGIVSPLLDTSNCTWCRMVLFCRPVAPIRMMLFMGSVGMIVLFSNCIRFNSILSIKDTFAPVSVSYTHLDVYKRQLLGWYTDVLYVFTPWLIRVSRHLRPRNCVPWSVIIDWGFPISGMYLDITMSKILLVVALFMA